jgi:hypothetical protein
MLRYNGGNKCCGRGNWFEAHGTYICLMQGMQEGYEHSGDIFSMDTSVKSQTK